MKPATPDTRGFTLIEIVVSLLVLSIASAVIFEGFSVGFRNTRTADDFTRAVMIAQSKLAPAGIAEPLTAGSRAGEALGKYAWTVRIDPVALTEQDGAAPRDLQPYFVAVDVVWNDGGTERTVSLSTLRLGPR